MVSLSPKQFFVLIRLSRSPITSINGLRPRDFQILRFLDSCGYVSIQTRRPDDTLNDASFSSAEISELGFSYLFASLRNLFCFFIPVIISICSLVISIFTLCNP